MHKIASNGATEDNRFTEGNAALSVPATVVSADWLNAVQDEIVNVVQGAGLSLESPTGDDGTQLLQAIEIFIANGGQPASRILQPLANNQSSPADITGFGTFDSSVYKVIEFLYDILRRTDSGHVKETGRCFMSYDSETSSWGISALSVFDDSNVDFVATTTTGSVSKLQYKTDNLAGSSYAGNLRISDIKRMKV